MIVLGSRFDEEQIYETRDDRRSTEPIRGLAPHEPPVMNIDREHVVVQGERLDQIAQRYYGDPLKFWLVCDANDAIFPDELLVPGRVIVIPRNRL